MQPQVDLGLLIAGPFDSVFAGDNHTCAIQTNGSLMCWGSNANGQLGIVNALSLYNPTAVDLGSGANEPSIAITYARRG